MRAETKKESQVKIAKEEALLKIKSEEAEGIKLLKEAKADSAVLTLKVMKHLIKAAGAQLK